MCYAKRPYFLFCRWRRSFLKSIICFGDKLLNFVATPRMFPFPATRDALLIETKNAKMIARIIWSFIFQFYFCSDIFWLWLLIVCTAFIYWIETRWFTRSGITRKILEASSKRRICLVGSFQALIRQCNKLHCRLENFLDEWRLKTKSNYM